MTILPDKFTIWEQFLKGIPYEMLLVLIMDGGLVPKVNTIEGFVVKARAYKSSIKIVAHYLGYNWNHTLHSGLLVYKQADKAVQKGAQ